MRNTFPDSNQPIYDQHGLQRFALRSLVSISSVSVVLQSQSVFFSSRQDLPPSSCARVLCLFSKIFSRRLSLSFLASALAFGHLASFLQKLRPSISLFRTLLVPPIISVRTLYQQVMPECVDSGSSHSVHSSVVVLGRGHIATADSQALPNWIRMHVLLQPAPLFRMRCLFYSSGPPSSLREVPDVPPTETFDWRPSISAEPSSSLSDLSCLCEPSK